MTRPVFWVLAAVGLAAACVSGAVFDHQLSQDRTPLALARPDGSAPGPRADQPGDLAFDEPTSVAAPVPEVLRLALARPASLRPDQISLTDQSAVIVADLLYDGLTRADAASGQLAPTLARN